MMKKMLAMVVAAAFGPTPIHRGFARVCDSASAFAFRMGAGFEGDVTRTHPVDIEPVLVAVATPPTFYGEAVLTAAANAGVRPFAAADTAIDTPYGVVVRSYPGQQTTGGMTATFGTATPPASGVIDVLRRGYIAVKIPAAQAATPSKGSAVFVRCQNAGAGQRVGGFEAAADGGNTAALDTKRFQFNGPADADGNVELMFKV